MTSNIDKFKLDLEQLIKQGNHLLISLQYRSNEKATLSAYSKLFKSKEELKAFFDELPNFNSKYQCWYSESLYLIRQIIPMRLDDFIRLYEKPKSRKILNYESYRIEDALHNLCVRGGTGKVKVDSSAAINLFEQQIAIVESAKKRFGSSLFDINQTIQADLFDSEIEAAEHLIKQKFIRAGGALVGVVLERHLKQVCLNHNIKELKKNMTISTCNDILKNNEVIDQTQWRFIQFLGDIRNSCDHANDEPTKENVLELIDGVKKIIKTIY
ncbi:hypothetical protein [Gilliamella sp. wkB112]|uniref:hypothetical protein n=1 Tax=Gilliamella sp. wkB112 TaxID=3120257 RepID=UPI00080E6290|nr:hypothetical protein [Gilliamella apicola]OCG01489.1 hypothetical protein A9G12_02795 [Gilliamella apicola]